MTEKEAQIINTGRLLRAESDVLVPMLVERRELIVQKIIMLYKAGDFERIRDCSAELSLIEDMKLKIKNKILAADAVERKLNGDNNGKQ
jgi:hypothetical protein